MKDKTLVGGIIVMVIGALLIGIVWFFFLKPTIAPSAPIEAIPIEIEGDSNSYIIFEITQAESSVSFTLEETLRGLPTTVVGFSQEVSGQIALNFADLPASQVGSILINARTLQTDNEFRNNAIHNFILTTEDNEFIMFTPTQIRGVPANIAADTPTSFQIEGDLTIRGITQTAVFSTTVTTINTERLVGKATANILRSDYNLQIPDAPGVANVNENVALNFEFHAISKQ